MSWLPEHLPGERLAIKIWQTVTERGISGLLSPWQIKRVGRAHADVRRLEIQTLAQAYRDGADILAGRKTMDESGRLVERKPTGDPSVVPAGEGQLTTLPNQTVPLLEGLRQEQSCRELERAINLRTTIAMAEGEASSIADENVSDEPVSPDWFARWRANAEEVHDDEMRRFWARILAGEAEKPGRFSLHTLDFMRRLSKEDAALIEKVAPFVTGRDLIYDDLQLDRILARRGLNFGLYLELQDLGVMSGVEGLGRNKTWTVRPPTRTNFRFWNRALSVSSQESKTLELSIYGITKVGAQVMSLGNFRADNEYVHAVGQLILEKGFEVDLGDVAEVRDGRFRIADAQPVGRRVHRRL